MSEMVERLRKVFDDIILWADDKYEIDTTQLARAAIEAMRDPPGPVYVAFRNRLCELMEAGVSTQYIVDESLATFFDSALKEKPE